MKLAQILTVMFFLFSFPLFAQEEPTAAVEASFQEQEKPLGACSINQEIGCTVYSSGRIELRYAPEVKPSKRRKTASASKVQIISVRPMGTSGEMGIEWSRTCKMGKRLESRTFRVASVTQFATISVATGGLNEPVHTQRDVRMKKVQGRLLFSVVERLVLCCEPQMSEADRAIKPMMLEPTLAKDIIAIFAAAQGDFYTTLPKKEKKAAKEPQPK